MNEQYKPCECEHCQNVRLNLENKTKPKLKFKTVFETAERAFKKLYKNKGYKPEDLFKNLEYKELIDANTDLFSSAIPHTVPSRMRTYLDQDVFIFSALKAHTELTEARQLLKDENGNIRPYYDFEQKVLKLNKTYNTNYLEAEYEFAVASSQSAANWADLSNDTDRYWLEYRTAGDDRVRDTHDKLRGTVLPKDDPFWSEFYPPNGWRCRCVAIEVLAREYEKSDSQEAIKKARAATTQIGRNGKNKLEMFRFNPGLSKKVFPPKNSYTKVVGADKVLEKAESIKLLKTTEDLSTFMQGFAEKYPETFARGFKEIQTTRIRGVNGFTDLNGRIALTEEILKECIAGINNIQLKNITTLKQEIALSTLNHEIMHNYNKVGNVRLSTSETKTMELANEFIARKTLPEFMERLGGELQNKELINTRRNTGYNTMVVNYDKLIEWTGTDTQRVIKTVKEHLIEQNYRDQMNGLIKGITENSNYKNKQKIKSAITNAKKMSNEDFEEYLKTKFPKDK